MTKETKALIAYCPTHRPVHEVGQAWRPMKISYDPEVDALSITFLEAIVTTKHLGEGIAADYDGQGRLAGIEILDAVRRFGGQDTLRQVTFEGIGPTAPV